MAQLFWRRRFFNFVNVFFAISWLSPLGKSWGPSFEQPWIPFTQGCFVPILVEIKLAQCFWRRRFFYFVNVFLLFHNYLPLEKDRALDLINIESPSPKDALCQVQLKLAQWFWKWRLFNFINVFLLFRNYLPLEKGGALHLNKLESPSPKNAMCQVWLKLAQWFWRRRFFNFVNVFFPMS